MPALSPESLPSLLGRGTIRVGYSTVDFETAVRGLLVAPLLAHGVNPARVDDIVDCVLKREGAGSTCAGPRLHRLASSVLRPACGEKVAEGRMRGASMEAGK